MGRDEGLKEAEPRLSIKERPTELQSINSHQQIPHIPSHSLRVPQLAKIFKMVKTFVAVALFALIAMALAIPQGAGPQGVRPAAAEGKTGDLQTANSFYGGYYGGYPGFYGGYGYGYPGFYGGYGGYYGHGYGYGYPYYG